MSKLFPSRERAVSPKVLLLIALGIGAFSSAALSQTDTWKGGNGNWSNASMWSLGVPGASSNVFIDNGNPVASLVTLDQSDTISNLTINSDDKLSFNGNTQLTVSGGSISNAGQMTINGGSATNSELTLGAESEVPPMFKRIFSKRFKIGDRVRLIRTGQDAVIIAKSTLPVAKKEATTFVLKFENGSASVKVLPEDIERAA